MIVATRSSPLARWQAEAVSSRLKSQGIEVEFLFVATEGDKDRTRQIQDMAGEGVFVKEVQIAVLDGRADIAVHSAKDLRSRPTNGLNLVGFLERGDPRDALIGNHLDQIPEGGVIATGSARRRVQLVNLRPDLKFVGLRGNIKTRIEMAQGTDVDAVVVAKAALDRLGISDLADQVFESDQMVPQVGQGAIAIECRDDDRETIGLISPIVDELTGTCVMAERSYLAELGGGCELPVGAYAYDDGDLLCLETVLASLDGGTVLRTKHQGKDPITLGAQTAQELLASGGYNLLAKGGDNS
ncbi:MAG: hydroxymethylbilane synthase [Acidimicrobiales bacterium]|jgi:hydroxymethylbilane synthase|nr:hydroxymethylbilane synthase [Acidimicrobiales bacterium]